MIIPFNNPLTIEGVELGKKLFNDPILSADNSLSCSGCHIQNNSFTNTTQYSTGTVSYTHLTLPTIYSV